MSLWQRIADLFTGRTRAQHDRDESDVEPNPARVDARPTGGRSDPNAPDTHSTTGPSANHP